MSNCRIGCSTSVSYIHLDVYKRQRLGQQLYPGGDPQRPARGHQDLGAPNRTGAAAVSTPVPPRRKALLDDPTQFGFLSLLREIERGQPDKPRIGRNVSLRDEAVRLGQEPFQAFPASNVSQVQPREDGRLLSLIHI